MQNITSATFLSRSYFHKPELQHNYMLLQILTYIHSLPAYMKPMR